MDRLKSIWLPVAVSVTLILVTGTVYGEQFTYKYAAGDKYHILSTVEQTVSIDGVVSHTAHILNRIAVSVDKVKGTSGHLVADFQTSEESLRADQLYQWGEEYHSEFWRDAQGYYDIAARYFMPVVRNVPVFPNRDLKKGDTWSAEGEETHDFRRSFGIQEPFNFTVPVSYTYLGKENVDGKAYDSIGIRYNVFYQVQRRYTGMYPTLITGYSDQKLLWDPQLGMPYSYHEKYEFILTLSTGHSVQYSGTAKARIIQSSTMDRAKIAADIQGTLNTLGVKDTQVKTDARGVTISLQNIQFLPDSAVLVESEKQKLSHIADILRKYPNRDILISGYTALAGTSEGRRKLSGERAAAVGQFLLDLGVRTRDHMIYRGLGAKDPVADNSTEEGRQKNRRVEITIMEN
jgi:outer membrane protein OmpA-like peptidoglycan-associated protein